MNSNELYNQLEIVKNKYDELLKLIEIEKNKNFELSELLKSCLSFRTFDVINVIAELISIKENDSYAVVFCNEDTNFTDYRKVGFAISKYFGDNKALRKYIRHLKSLNSSLYGTADYIDIYYNEHKKCDPNLQCLKYITFACLLNKYDLLSIHSFNSTIKCQNSFKNYEYVNDFIEYLFDLQVQKNGEHLTYEEMQKALDDFLNKEKNKPKQKIKEKDKES